MKDRLTEKEKESEDKMIPKERVIAQIEHEETDFIPFVLQFEEERHSSVENGVLKSVNSCYGTAWRDKLDNNIIEIPTAKFGKKFESREKYSTDMYGCKWRTDKRPIHLEKPALEEPTLRGYKFPELDAFFDRGWREKCLQLIDQKKDHFLVTSLEFGLFESTWSMRGFENALMDCIAHPDFYKELVEKIFEHHMAFLDELLSLPIDGFLYGDDYGHQYGIMIGVEKWREFFKPYLKRMYRKVHDAGKYTLQHMCGSMVEILPDLIEIGLDVYQSVQPEAKDNSPYRLKELYGKNITFWGGLGSQSTIPFGTPAGIKEEVRRLCREMGKGGGYILGPAKAIQPGTPTENAVAVIQAFAEQAGVCI